MTVEKLISKLKKCLALSARSEPHEAAPVEEQRLAITNQGA